MGFSDGYEIGFIESIQSRFANHALGQEYLLTVASTPAYFRTRS